MNQRFPLGVDLIEFKKAEFFYQTHKRRLGSFFDPQEVRYVRQSPKPYESLALLLAAKEAVFKALSLSWMGLTGFKDIRILRGRKNKFFFELKGKFKKMSRHNLNAKLSFVKTKDYVVVRCCPARDL